MAGLGHPKLEIVATRRGDLRILAYHGIPDIQTFAEQMAHLATVYSPVASTTIIEAAEGKPLPPRAVWVTFDDGHPEVVNSAQRVLDHHGISATLFVCPGMVGTSRPYWWEIVGTALQEQVGCADLFDGKDESTALKELKQVDDDTRRQIVETLEARLRSHDLESLDRRQITEGELRSWQRSGHELGNHSWDHPCLNRCEPSQQRRQIQLAHDWLEERFGKPMRLFAYPNGDRTEVAEETLRELGYAIGTLFDHRVVGGDGGLLAMSRLRVDASAPLPRFRAIVSGVHPTLFHLSSVLGP